MAKVAKCHRSMLLLLLLQQLLLSLTEVANYLILQVDEREEDEGAALRVNLSMASLTK